jgi:hypothetical protein
MELWIFFVESKAVVLSVFNGRNSLKKLGSIFWLDGNWIDDLSFVWLSQQQIEEKNII